MNENRGEVIYMSEMKWINNIFNKFSTKKENNYYEDEFEDMFLYAESHLHITREVTKPTKKIVALKKKGKQYIRI